MAGRRRSILVAPMKSPTPGSLAGFGLLRLEPIGGGDPLDSSCSCSCGASRCSPNSHRLTAGTEHCRWTSRTRFARTCWSVDLIANDGAVRTHILWRA
jgi:hypothetical protein